MTLVCKSYGIGNNIFNPIYGSGDKITPDINHKCGKKHWPCPDNSKKIGHLYVSLIWAWYWK